MIFKRWISLLLALVFLLGLVPRAYAAEGDDPTAPTEPTIYALEDEPDTQEEPLDTPAAAPGIMPMADTTSGVTLFDLASPNYTVTLSSQLTVKYKPYGASASVTAYIKNLGWHFPRINNVSYENRTLFCIEPHKNYAASTPGNYVDDGTTLDGSGSSRGAATWYALPRSCRESIMLTLLYCQQRWDDSYNVKTTAPANNPNVPLRVATQFLIYELVCGLRDPDTFERNSSNGYTSGDIFYNAGTKISGFTTHYNAIVSSVQSALMIPSFAGKTASSAPTITMDADEISVQDTNGVLGNFSIPDGNGASFDKSGNRLYITKTGNISPSTVYTLSRNLPSVDNSTVSVFYPASTTYQTCVALCDASNGTLNGYFKLKPPVSMGALSIAKTTSDGKNLGGWQFSIYADQGCTNRISGPHTSDASGNISVGNLNAGTYYVKELGHSDSGINASYTCASTNPQRVTVSSGQTATVSFTNTLKSGGLSLTKTTEDGKNLGGWQFSIFSDQGCTNRISGPHTTDANGKFTVPGLSPGTVYVKEMGHENADIAALYRCDSQNPQKVVIAAGQTASVSFLNKLLPGNLKLFKQTNTGTDLSGWRIGVFTDQACKNPIPGSPFTTGADGTVTITGLHPGIYYAQEEASSDPAWECDTALRTVTVIAGRTSTLIFKNVMKFGNVKLIKETNTGGDLGGWKIGLYTDQDCKAPISGSPFTTGEDGTFTVNDLKPGVYYAKEEPSPDPLWECDTGVKKVTVVADQTATVTFANKLRSGQLIIHKVNREGSPLAGAAFLLEWSADGEGWQAVASTEAPTKGGCTSPGLKDGKLVSGEDGLISFTGLWPGLRYRLTETAAPEGYQLLAERAYEGELPIEQNLHLEVTVVNMHTFQLPKTGSKALVLMPLSVLLCLGVCAGLLIRRRRR